MKTLPKSEDPKGYSPFRRRVEDDDGGKAVVLLLPDTLKQSLEAEEKQAKDSEFAERVAEARRLQQEQDDRHFSQSRNGPSSKRNEELDPKREAAELVAPQPGIDYDPQTGMPVYTPDEPLKLIRDIKTNTPDREVHKRNEVLYRQIKVKGSVRRIAAPSGSLAALEQLRQTQPHFGAVIDLVRDQLILADATAQPLSLPPILLGGDPGIGKTHFTHKLSQTLGTVMRRQSFDNDQTGAALMGSDKRWANTACGIVFELVVLGEYANPVILLDEIDKASKYRDADPLAPLHSLLEPVTARRVRDISVEFEFDASRVIWIATANDLRRIPTSLRSRFAEFTIQQPSGEQALQMAEAVAVDVHRDMDINGFESPSYRIARLLAHLTAREQVQALKRAYAAAVVNGRRKLLRQDLPAEALLDEQETPGSNPPSGLLH